MEKMKENIVQVKGSLLELEKLFKEGKDRNDAKVKDIEGKIRIALDIPRECSINSGQTLKDMIESLHKHVGLVQNSPIPSEMIPGKEVLKNASGGLALEGVFKTRKPDDLLVEKEQLIEIPDSFSLTSPKQSTRYEQKEFSSHKSATTFLKIMERIGHDYGLDIFKDFGLRVEIKYQNETEKTTSSSQEESYILHTKYNYIPLASGSFQRDKLKLSTGAVNALKEIEMISLHSDGGEPQTNQVRCFYERFGSHVYQGPMHFGGIFWWKAVSSGFRSNDLSEVKELTSKVLDAYCGWVFAAQPTCGKAAASVTHLSGLLTGKHREDLMSQVHLSVSKTGGPPEIDDHFLWKSHLAANNRTWSVVERGTTLIPVWEILTASHRDDFKDVSKLSRILMDAYKEITGEHVEEMWGENILSQLEKAETLMQSMKTWSTTDCESTLIRLMDFKNRLFNETGSHKIWHQKCLSNDILQNYLFEVVTANSEATAVTMRFLMRPLLDPDLYKVENFPNRSQIVNWAYQTEEDQKVVHVSVSDLSELDRVLQQTIKELEDSRYAFNSPEDHSAKIKTTSTLALAINSLSKKLVDSDQEETKLLILSIITVIGYSCQNKMFNHLLRINEITFLQSELHNAFSQYSCLRKQCPIKAQAYLLLTALTVSTDKDATISRTEKEKRLQLVLTELKDKLSSPIELVLKNRQDDWEYLEKALHSITLGRQEDTEIRERKDTEVECQLEDVVMRVAPLPEFPETDEHNSPVCVNDEKGKSFIDLLQKMGLQDSYPKKMRKESVLVIDRLSLSVEQPKTEKDLSSHYLYKLMMLDYRARYLFVKAEGSRINVEVAGANGEDDDNDDDDLFSSDDEKDLLSSEQTHIHPMDVLMTIFHCSTDFLRQFIFTKLSACQFSLPFLVPNPCTHELEFPAWALRHIKKSWHSKAQTTSDHSRTYYNRQMFNTPMPIIAFIRLGDSNLNSKSQILNGVINKQKHPVFFHRHCEGSTPHSLLMDGVVEIAWYCPGGKEDDVFDDCVAFLNLHGDAAEHPKQLEFLQAVSTVIVLLISEHPRSESAKEISQRLSKSRVPLICLFSAKEKVQQSKKCTNVRLAAKNRNQAEFREELVSSIKLCISEYNHSASIEMCMKAARKQQFIVDEDKQSCKDADGEAHKLINHLKNVGLLTLKDKILPLQSQLWHDWCKKNKEVYRLQSKENISLEQQLSEISSDMAKIRRRQLKMTNSVSNFMTSFLNCLTVSNQFEDKHLYMMQWLRILLDDLITDELASLEGKYHSIWREMKTVPKGNSSNLCQMQNRLNCITDQIAATTFGLQHIMREVSQLYEAIQHSLQDNCSMTNANKKLHALLPKIGATMLISGYPLELMDGDAAHVPLTWITAVLDDLIKTVGDKKVFVISILGLQSSGKSTLLNTMFGLQFDVSAGRCTRGAFMQLIKVDPSIRKELGYDFVLIVDTEGLRSPELSTKISLNHDNELATFIIGIGDVTVINIMGENPSEIQDILQICVQAFLRMKQVEITPSCIFVHQNVAESSARDKNAEGRRRLMEKLDEMAQMAAKEENDNRITCFSDVIQFDIDTQGFYFKNLLEGDPPMAPPNPSYSQNVQELKTMLLNVRQLKDKCNLFTLSELRHRISDLWNALLQENFVFSFKNTFELMVYNSLEHEYGKWSWELRKHSLNLQTKLQNKIESDLIKEVSFADLTKEFDEVFNLLETEITKYFSDDKYKETLIKWKESSRIRFTNLNNELIEGTMKKCKDLLTAKQNRSELDKNRAKFTDDLTKLSKTLAAELRTQYLTDEEITVEFDRLWTDWTTNLLRLQPPEEPRDVKAIVETVLLKKFQKYPNILAKVRGEDICKQQSVLQCLEALMEKITHAVNDCITNMEISQLQFDEKLIYEILSIIETNVADYKNTPESPNLHNEFMVDLSVHVCLQNISRIQKLHEKSKTSNAISVNPQTPVRLQFIEKFLRNLWAKIRTQTAEEPLVVKNVVEAVLCKHFHNQPNIEHKVQGRRLHTQQNQELENYFESWKKDLDNIYQTIMKQVTHTVNKYMDTKESSQTDFNENFIYEMLLYIEKDIAESEKIYNRPFTNDFRVNLCVYLCLKTVTRFNKMHEEFRRTNNPLTYLESQKETYFQAFKNYCKGASSVTIFVDFLCKYITPQVLGAANNKTCQQIADNLKNNDPALNGNRSNLEKHILMDLATQESLSLYVYYIDSPKEYFERIIQEKVNTFCCDAKNLSVLFQENLEYFKNQLLTANSMVTKEVVDKKGNVNMWLDLFCKEMGKFIVIRKADLRSIEKELINDWPFLKEMMCRSLEDMIRERESDVMVLSKKPTTILFEQLQGCWAQCPFCGAICTNTIPNHDGDHSVQFHRSEAVNGMHWEGTDNFTIDFCTTLVSSDCTFSHGGEWFPYKNYRSAGDPYDRWSITADGSSQRYWKWFLCKFQSQWEEKCGYKFTGNGKFPPEWEKYKKEDALKELK